MTRLLLHEVTLGEHLVDVMCENGQIISVDPPRGRNELSADVIINGEGRAVIPGLHDHHTHLFATAAARQSVHLGPPNVTSREEMVNKLRIAHMTLAAGAWIRAVGYHESVAGDLDRTSLDVIAAEAGASDVAIRIQHRSGAMWILNTVACEMLSLDKGDPRRVSGQIWREDTWLRTRISQISPSSGDTPPDLRALGAHLASMGVTSVTDMTPIASKDDLMALAVSSTTFPQHVTATGDISLAQTEFPAPLRRGPVKVIIADHDLPALDTLVDTFSVAHHHNRSVAVHCVSRAALVLALTAWSRTGTRNGDRIEHASLVPEQLIRKIAELGLRIVTQPNFISERGDTYLAEIDEAELDDLYRLRSLTESGVRLAAGTDTPYGDPDPWLAIRAAKLRRTLTGQTISTNECVSGAEALNLFLSAADDPGGPPRTIASGQPADLVMLTKSLAEVMRSPNRNAVHTTIISGEIVHGGPT